MKEFKNAQDLYNYTYSLSGCTSSPDKSSKITTDDKIINILNGYFDESEHIIKYNKMLEQIFDKKTPNKDRIKLLGKYCKFGIKSKAFDFSKCNRNIMKKAIEKVTNE